MLCFCRLAMADQKPHPPRSDFKPAEIVQKWLEKIVFTHRARVADRTESAGPPVSSDRIDETIGENSRFRANHLAVLSEITRSLRDIHDQPVAAQLVVNAIRQGYECELAAVFIYEEADKEFQSYAVAGKIRSFPPPAYRQTGNRGMLGKVLQTKKTIVSSGMKIEGDFHQVEAPAIASEIIVPLIQDGIFEGVLVVDDEKCAAFNNSDIALIEIAADELVAAWERSRYQQRLTDLIQSGLATASSQEIQAVIDQIANMAKDTLDAQFAFVSVNDPQNSLTYSSHAGKAPLLYRSLKNKAETEILIRETMASPQILRVRDIRNFDLTRYLKSDHAEYTNLLAFPIRVNQKSLGAILVFGKRDQASFPESDGSFAGLFATQAAAAIEGSLLLQSLRSTLQVATLLFQLSSRILQAEDLTQAAQAIAETAYGFGHVSKVTMVLFTPDRQVQANVEVGTGGISIGTSPPAKIIDMALQTGKISVISDAHSAYKICLPIQTPHQVYGALWLELPDGRWYDNRFADNLQTLTNQATVALERSSLLARTDTQTRQLEAAFEELENTYDQTLIALTSALDARDRETEDHSTRVREIVRRLGGGLGLSPKQLKALERGALLHDIGKIGVSDHILLKPGPLNESEWDIMHQHPEIGARIVEKVPFLSDSIAVVRYHHERWNGKGYPLGLVGEEIPLLARIFAVVDTYDALISDRPYRKKLSEKEAAAILTSNAGSLYDPEIVKVFIEMLTANRFADILQLTRETPPDR